jgi:hypothetical protein
MKTLIGSLIGLNNRGKIPKTATTPWFYIVCSPAVFTGGIGESYNFDTSSILGNKDVRNINWAWIDMTGITTEGTVNFDFDVYNYALQSGSQGYYPIISSQIPFKFTLNSFGVTGSMQVILLHVPEDAIGTAIQIFGSGSGGGGIKSINSDTTSAQTLAAGSGITIVDGGSGLHTISATGVASDFTYDATITGIIDGTNPTFTLPTAPTIPLSLMLYKNGVKLLQGTAFSLSTNTITFNSGYIPQIGDLLEAAMYI